ncbi:hypothetical protein BS47DRAFT_1357464 [Hydnum rufescens UP504]|uniref:Uncharacterized protein n=1 Tax=Hydnum rufescens UP504 TaxID=1448309 RepID=A0A9P6BAS7_9AGAM|nr:hypothetical protein BS47DRAFT_1357464 [Hydnum rufescens UP504]
MEQLEEVVLTVCPCSLAAIQLVEHSFFPCAPLFPTLAVSLNMLKFVASLFLHMAPNERAWAVTLVEYLKACGYEFATGDSFWQCFSNALVHYQVLVQLVRAEITRIVQDDKRGLISELDEKTPVHEWGYLNVQSNPKLFANSTPTNASANAPATILTYHPEDDTVGPGLHALNLTYDACWQSFIAADEDCIKASTQYFEDTGVIALLCHHDIPLAVASMWTAGEKQFYVFALLETVLKHALSHWRIGPYGPDSEKWRFMPEWLPRLEWGVSIFHVYGHQWACQLMGMPALVSSSQISSEDSQMMKGSQTKGAQAVEWIISLMATLEAQQGNLKDLIAEGNDLVQGDMTASNEVQAEWQEKVRLQKEAIWQLETMINKKTDELQLTDCASASELNRLKKDKWVNIQLNLHALHEQLLKKLRARKFKLATLDCANLRCILDQKTKAHVKKAVKNQSGGIEATVKKYNARLKELVVLRGRGGIWRDAYIPPMLTMDGLYKLDVDQDTEPTLSLTNSHVTTGKFLLEPIAMLSHLGGLCYQTM